MVSRSSFTYIKKNPKEQKTLNLAHHGARMPNVMNIGEILFFLEGPPGGTGIAISLPWALQGERLSQDMEDKETLLSGQEMNQNENFPNSLSRL